RENFDAICACLEQMEQVIRLHQGMMTRHRGEAAMALFASADDAVRGSMAMLKKLADYNQEQQSRKLPGISMGIGINTGQLLLGAAGSEERMDCMAVSEAVNLASRIAETAHGTGFVTISENTYARLQSQYAVRSVDGAKIDDKPEPVYEVLHALEDVPDAGQGL
ncbi:MAG: adenylate/guanylate cyclase domain-containing protein, partial [Gammaproteobacteria bacterium]|nr:adenylate/guanylate cyclase domain-containing protein [Gammaproteobacteria bacterium]